MLQVITNLALTLSIATALAICARGDEACGPTAAENAAMTAALRVATSGSAGAQEQLGQLKEESQSPYVRAFVDRLLSGWDDAKHTYVLARPASTDARCFCDLPAASRDRQRSGTALTARVKVDEEGYVTDVVPLGSNGNDDLLPSFVLALKHRRYVPASDGVRQTAASLDVLCRVEVR